MLKSEVQRRVRLPQADRKATVSEINTCYKQGMQKSFSECRRRIPHWVSFLSAKKRKMRLIKNWAIGELEKPCLT